MPTWLLILTAYFAFLGSFLFWWARTGRVNHYYDETRRSEAEREGRLR